MAHLLSGEWVLISGEDCSNSTKAGCFVHIDPKYTLTAPSHWAEVMQTPNLLGRSLTLNNVVSSPANCQGSMGQGVVVGGGGTRPTE